MDILDRQFKKGSEIFEMARKKYAEHINKSKKLLYSKWYIFLFREERTEYNKAIYYSKIMEKTIKERTQLLKELKRNIDKMKKEINYE